MQRQIQFVFEPESNSDQTDPELTWGETQV